MPRRPCLTCGTLIDGNGSRCAPCQRPLDTATLQAKRQRRPRISRAEERRRAGVVSAWRQAHGDVCPGWHRPAHAATDLTADHDQAVGAGGPETGPLSVLCRSCNGAKADH